MTAVPQVCKQCGKCCEMCAAGIYATVEDQRRWIREGRTDILCYFHSLQGDVEWCEELTNPDDVTTFADMLTPGGFPYKVCPFRKKIREGKYKCRIHETKPEVCRDFTPWVDGWNFRGESYDWCAAVKDKTWRKTHEEHSCESTVEST